MESRWRVKLMGALCALVPCIASPVAAAEVGFAMHAEAVGARMIGSTKVDQFGFGAGGWLSPELSLGGRFGFELPLGAVVLSDAPDGPEEDLGLEPSGTGYAAFAVPSLRVRPFGRAGRGGAFDAAGLWISAGGGAALTGKLVRPAVAVRMGYDLFAARLFRVGPSVGFVQIIEGDDGVLPQDARLAVFGLHAAFEKTAPPIVDDRDRDGIWDKVDKCPEIPEDKDGFEDEDGCPDLDNDQDGIPDKVDSCPLEPEDKDGFEDDDGCPDFDNDQDGVPDKKDKCPEIPEDKDGFEDEDGCPDLDNDQDGFPDNVDKCPNDPETLNDYADDDGCPDEKLVRVRGDEILLDERVYFRTNMNKIEIRSWGLLETVAKLLKANPQYERIRIQGHADQRGDEKFNQTLSQRRGQAVRMRLIASGVAADRLVVEAFGASRPLRDGRGELAWKKNRRVEFRIIQRAKLVPASEAKSKQVEPAEAPAESGTSVTEERTPAEKDNGQPGASPSDASEETEKEALPKEAEPKGDTKTAEDDKGAADD